MPDPDLLRFSLNQATTPAWSVPQVVDACARAGLGGVGLWRDRLAETGVDQAARLVRDSGLSVPSLCKSASLAELDATARRANLDENRRALEEAAAVGAGCLVMVVGGVDPSERDIDAARARMRDSLVELAPHALATGVRLGLEPLHPMTAADRSCLNTLAQANDLCDELGAASAIVADVYHCWWDPRFAEELKRAGAERIATFHYCDWLYDTRDRVFDRGMVGDGVIDHARIRGWLDAMAYDGPFELEIFSQNDWWKRDPAEVLRIAVERCRPFVGPRSSVSDRGEASSTG